MAELLSKVMTYRRSSLITWLSEDNCWLMQTRTAIGILVMQLPQTLREKKKMKVKGQMHHHNDLGSKCAYTCHLSNKTTRKSVLLSTPQIWLMKVSKKLA